MCTTDVDIPPAQAAVTSTDDLGTWSVNHLEGVHPRGPLCASFWLLGRNIVALVGGKLHVCVVYASIPRVHANLCSGQLD
jgi:hypothetical protein